MPHGWMNGDNTTFMKCEVFLEKDLSGLSDGNLRRDYGML